MKKLLLFSLLTAGMVSLQATDETPQVNYPSALTSETMIIDHRSTGSQQQLDATDADQPLMDATTYTAIGITGAVTLMFAYFSYMLYRHGSCCARSAQLPTIQPTYVALPEMRAPLTILVDAMMPANGAAPAA